MRKEFPCRILCSNSFSVYMSDAIMIIESEHFTILLYTEAQDTVHRHGKIFCWPKILIFSSKCMSLFSRKLHRTNIRE